MTTALRRPIAMRAFLARDSASSARAWRWALVAAAMLGLLLALGLVVQSAVRQAALRHADMAAQSDALWRCNAVSGRDARAACRREAGTITAADRR